LTIPPPCLLPFHILRPAGLPFPLFLPQDIVNVLSDFLGFSHFLFQFFPGHYYHAGTDGGHYGKLREKTGL
jgi:hypothetical protein